MSFFKIFVVAWAVAMVIGVAFDRLFPEKSISARGAVYGLIGFSVAGLVFWTLIQMIFSLPKFDDIFPVTAVLLGAMFAIGVKGAYKTLKDRHALKKRK